MKPYLEKKEAVLKEFGAGENGLSDEEARSRLEKYGENKLKEAKKKSLLRRFLKQLSDPMIIILIAAAVVSLIVSIIEGGEGFAEVIIIAVVVLLNAILGVVQEGKAENAIAALQKMTEATSKVVRGGRQISVESRQLTIGDIVVLEAGDAVPADMRLIESASMKIEEAALTGESVPADKDIKALTGDEVPLGDRVNMAYTGSVVVYGRGKGIVTGIGMDTEMGKIAGMLNAAADEKTPLQKRLGQLSKFLTFVVLGVSIVVFLVKLLTSIASGITAGVVMDSFIIAVSLAVAAVPEGLATVVTLTLSMGVTKMSKMNAVIRKQTAVETLGCTQIICSDKTGTLTQNKMTVVEAYGDDKQLLARALALCSDAVLTENGVAGEPTERALVEYAVGLGIDKNELETAQPRIGEAPFDSERKMMTTVHKVEGGEVVYTKGAPDEILKICTHVYKGGKKVKMTDAARRDIAAENKRMADKALRIIAAAGFKSLDIDEDAGTRLEHDLVFIGLVGLIDPIRPEAMEAIAKCRTAGIRPIMITGDHIDTAVAIGKELGILEHRDQAITGAQLGAMSDEEFTAKVEHISVYARVQPEHKTRIVGAWKAKGYVTAMTGDGVNDAPSIKAADIGIGMGITGTDVTKQAADMILADDNFATVVAAVGEGRRIYDNIIKAMSFMLSSNLTEVIVILFATIAGFTIMEPAHLLWINLISDTFPAIALGMEDGEKDIMNRKPRSSKAGVFADCVGRDIIIQGLFLSVMVLLAYFIGHGFETVAAGRGFIFEFPAERSSVGITMAFLTLCAAKMFHIFNCRSRTASLFTMKKQNMLIWGAFGVSMLLTVAVIYIPGLNDAFSCVPLSAAAFFTAIGLAFMLVPFVELTKLITRRRADGICF